MKYKLTILSMIPIIGIKWASDKQLKNSSYTTWYMITGMVLFALLYSKTVTHFNLH